MTKSQVLETANQKQASPKFKSNVFTPDQSVAHLHSEGEKDQYHNIITETRRIIKNMTENQKFQKARSHVLDALGYKHPRPQSEAPEIPKIFKILYVIESSSLWHFITVFLAYVYMYLIILDKSNYGLIIALQSSILAVFLFDILMIYYFKSFDKFKSKNKYSSVFKGKCVLLIVMIIDLIMFSVNCNVNGRPVLPLRILRVFIPPLYDAEYRKSLYSLSTAYKDVLVYFIFYAVIICGFAIIGSRSLTFDDSYLDPNFPNFPVPNDEFKNSYSSLNRMIFIMYVTATYDSYPDNNLRAVQNSQWNYIFWIVFIFLNMFLFTSIPGSLVYNTFRYTRSKIILIDQMKQQHSLILAFVTLAEDQKNLSIDRLISFLLYLYKYKIRFVENITEICLRLDDNNNRSIQVNEFMQLSKILLENHSMIPPTFYDIECWVRFRSWANRKLYLKKIVKHWIFELSVSIIIILCFINSLFFLYMYAPIVETFDTIFIWFFFGELLVRIVAIGPQNFFHNRWNNVDTFLVVFSVSFYFVPIETGVDSVARMSRIFRIATLFRLVSHSNFLSNVNFEITNKLAQIFSTLLEIMPIIIKFFPLFMFFFYIFGVIGMEVFYDTYKTPGLDNYRMYEQYSHFRNFINTQYIMVQVMTEAGWSMIAFDHSNRNPNYTGLIMTFFCIMHVFIVLIIATLVKGIFWEVFFTVSTTIKERNKLEVTQEAKEIEKAMKMQEYNQINQLINNSEVINPDSVLKRQLVENKLDRQIFKRLKIFYEHQKSLHSIKRIKSKRSIVVEQVMDDWIGSGKELELSEELHNKRHKFHRQTTLPLTINSIEQLDQNDFQQEMEQLLNHLIINPKIKFSEIVAYPRKFVEFLNFKFKKPHFYIQKNKFDLNANPLYNQESMYYHIYQIHAILGIQTSKREQKAMIIQAMVDKNILDEGTAQKLVRKKLNQKEFQIDTSGILRQMFLSQTNEQLIKKFEVQYFADLYGHSFKEINKMTLEPLLRFEASITYSLRNICRYPQIDNTQFFEMFTHIEDQLSNKLLKRGSLFKFVYKIDHESDIWFCIEYKRQQEMRIHFLKSGLWAYTKQQIEDQVYYAKDVFNWDITDESDKKSCEQYMKRFYQCFETLAFSLIDETKFFESNPEFYIYDLFIEQFEVQRINRYITRQLEISKIMLVILSKEQERKDLGTQPLPYSLSDIKPSFVRKRHDFNFDESDNETFQKLKNFSALDEEKIVESEGLPFSYIINLMKQVSDIMKLYSKNFIHQIQKVLNDQYQEINFDDLRLKASKDTSKKLFQ